ncbi:hypothetical protein EJ08DRAFT_468850 [Tothia fuscella]|uniref:Uncharacterized protein n=1 Tax=Tothia fuscella TaxID=1048955 RepID=A0A9P4U261_9PEZI|nr:hypothetical protein EJ08DRAFT_468850 [Tothia fuscella]
MTTCCSWCLVSPAIWDVWRWGVVQDGRASAQSALGLQNYLFPLFSTSLVCLRVRTIEVRELAAGGLEFDAMLLGCLFALSVSAFTMFHSLVRHFEGLCITFSLKIICAMHGR